MDKKKLYSIFHMHGHIHGGEWAVAPSKEGALLDDIIQAAEQETKGLRAERDQLRAQVAEMGEALRACASGDEWKDCKHLVNASYSPVAFAQQVCSELLEALSAAPKVWRMPGRTSKYYDLEVSAEDAPAELQQLLNDRGMYAHWDVMVCLPKGEQPEESEQEEG